MNNYELHFKKITEWAAAHAKVRVARPRPPMVIPDHILAKETEDGWIMFNHRLNEAVLGEDRKLAPPAFKSEERAQNWYRSLC